MPFVSKPFLRSLKSTLAITFHLDWLYQQPTYSQEGEDIVLRKLFNYKKNGVYVDVGAHHPYRYSNTHWLYSQGWHGINIDATPGSMRLFERTRPRDINLELAVGPRSKPLTYYLFTDPAFNTFSKQAMQEIVSNGQSNLLETQLITPQPLKTILDTYLPKNTEIDLLTVDAEGQDLNILKSNDWNKYRPQVVVIEVGAALSIEALLKQPLSRFLAQQHYKLYARLFNSAIYLRV